MSTTIEWTDETWNPTTGCDRLSAGCDNCYALPLAKRLQAMENSRIDLELLPVSNAKYQTNGNPRTSGPGFGIAMHPNTLTAPFSWRTPRKVFVNSMSDLFHDGVTDEFIARVFAVMAATPQHTYQILTKRHGRMRSLLSSERFADEVGFAWHEMLAGKEKALPWSTLPLPNVWLGVSVEDQKHADLRIPALLETPAAVRFISAEPLLGPVRLLEPYLTGWLSRKKHSAQTVTTRLDWVIVGGESGPRARPMHPDWARALRDQCASTRTAFHFKQWGEFIPNPSILEFHRGYPQVAIACDGGDPYEDEHSVYVWRVGKKLAGRELDGRTWDEFPERAA